ncbi:MAG: peptidoglycan-binding protein [Chthoniobacterales bacterium]|nr:peptidoglycan-binding protein [Chthoniobacterales bacterium]
MKRFFFSVLLFGICGVATLLADENVRAAQNRLKDGGFYFGEANGEYNAETAAAVSRYQIRNGLSITGELDAETAKALGIATVKQVSPNPDAADTWRRLRKADEQFLKELNARENTPAASPARDSSERKTTVLQPARAAGENVSTFVLGRERLRDYVAAFVLAGLDPREGAELEFFSDRVKYFDSGVINRDRIRRDLQAYDRRWPQRRFSLAGEVNVQPQADSRIRVTFPLRFDLRNGSRHSSGKVQKTLLLELTGGDDLRIVAVNERKAR